MAVAMTDSKWKIKKSLFMVLCLFPFLNSFVFFIMSSKIKTKKWTLIAWISFLLQILLIILMFGPIIVIKTPEIESPNMPKIEEYLGYSYSEKYSYDEYTVLPEYEQYREDEAKWKKTDEYLALYKKQQEVEAVKDGFLLGSFFALFALNIAMIGLTVYERPKYLLKLAEQENRNMVYNQLQDSMPAGAMPMQPMMPPNMPMQQPIQQPAIQQPVIQQPAAQNTAANAGLVDINTADEQQLCALPGINIIDAKKAISHREQNGPFRSTDEFFTVIRSKPHIMVNVMPLITVSTPQPAIVNEKKKPIGRRIDL